MNIRTGLPIGSSYPYAQNPQARVAPSTLNQVFSPVFTLPWLPTPIGSRANLHQIHSNFLGVPSQSFPAQSSVPQFNTLQILNQLIGMMMQVLQASQGATGAPAFHHPGPGAPAVPGQTAGPKHSPLSPPSPTPPQASAPSASGTATNSSSGTGASPIPIGPGTRVLEIGDSHTVGTFGKELDAQLRSTGAQVSTYASAGATASTFTQGKSTRYGYWQKDAQGREHSVGYGKSAPTPRLDSLIAKEKPQVIIVNLGANFRGSNPKNQVDEIGRVAKKHGIPIVWVGPPKTSKDNGNNQSLQNFDRQMEQAVAPYGTYVSSNQHTPKYSGGDGLHFGGREGTAIAKSWARGVFRDIVG